MEDLIPKTREIYGGRLVAFALGKKTTKGLDDLTLSDQDVNILEAMINFYEISNSRNSDGPSSDITRSLIMGSNFYEPRIDSEDYTAPILYLNMISKGEIIDDPNRITISAENYINDVWL